MRPTMGLCKFSWCLEAFFIISEVSIVVYIGVAYGIGSFCDFGRSRARGILFVLVISLKSRRNPKIRILFNQFEQIFCS
ncbi:hypothetical protein V6N13_011269 [Hibiscus sabdariffa]